MYVFISLLTISFLVTNLFTKSFAQNFWQQTSGPIAGRITDVARSPNGFIFVGTDYSGMYRSSDNGKSWKAVTSGISRISSVKISASGIILASASGIPGIGSAIIRTTDDGDHWETIIPFTPNDHPIESLEIDSQDFIYGISTYELSRSTDFGSTWKVMRWGYFFFELKNQIFGNTDYLYVADWNNGIELSTDHGMTWKIINNGLPAYQYNYFYNCPEIDSKGNLYTGGSPLYISTNKGQDWVGRYLFDKTKDTLQANSISISKSDEIFISAYGQGIYHSTDLGLNWEKININLPKDEYYVVIIDEQGKLYIPSDITDSTGLFYSSNNGKNWSLISKGIRNPSQAIIGLVINSQNKIFAQSGFDGIYSSLDNGNTWKRKTIEDGHRLYPLQRSTIVSNSKDHIYVGHNWSGLSRSTDDGNHWEEINLDSNNTHVSAIASNSLGHIFAGGEARFLRSTDDGTSWTLLKKGIPIYELSTLAINQQDVLFAGTRDSSIFRSNDNGSSWKKINNGLPDTVMIGTIAINSKGELFASTYFEGYVFYPYGSPRLYHSTNNGDSWSLLIPQSMNKKIISLFFDPNDYIYAGTRDSGLYRSTDHGINWTSMNDGLPMPIAVMSIAMNKDGFMFIGTDSLGVYRSKERLTSIKEIDNRTITSFSLSQNFPNPFGASVTKSNTTIISFTLPESVHAKLEIIDALGRIVHVLADYEYERGTYKISFDAKNLKSGIYFYRLMSNHFTAVKKMIFVQ